MYIAMNPSVTWGIKVRNTNQCVQPLLSSSKLVQFDVMQFFLL